MAEYVLHVRVADHDAERFEEEIEHLIDDEETLGLRTDTRRFDAVVEAYQKGSE